MYKGLRENAERPRGLLEDEINDGALPPQQLEIYMQKKCS